MRPPYYFDQLCRKLIVFLLSILTQDTFDIANPFRMQYAWEVV